PGRALRRLSTLRPLVAIFRRSFRRATLPPIRQWARTVKPQVPLSAFPCLPGNLLQVVRCHWGYSEFGPPKASTRCGQSIPVFWTERQLRASAETPNGETKRGVEAGV